MAKKQKQRERLSRRKCLALLRTFDDPMLQTVCQPVGPEENLDWLDDLKEVCQACPTGVGLAAPQIGILKRAVFIYPGRVSGYFMINPKVTRKSYTQVDGDEGCLSFPGCYGKVSRHEYVTVEFEKIINGRRRPVTETFYTFEARIVQHEIDHLDGVCEVRKFWSKP